MSRPKKKETDSKSNYAPSEARWHLLGLFLSGIYMDKDTYRKIFRHLPLVSEDILKREEHDYWHNTVEGIVKQYNTKFAVNNEKSKLNVDTVRRILNDFVSDGILVQRDSDDRNYNRKRFYPRESSEGLTALINYAESIFYKGGPSKWNSDLLRNNYTSITLNREFILDTLRRKNIQFEFKINYGDKVYTLKLPIIGRYRKVFESVDRMENLIAHVEKIQTYLEEDKIPNYSTIHLELFGTEYRYDDDPSSITEEKRKSNLNYLKKVIDHLEKASSILNDVKNDPGFDKEIELIRIRSKDKKADLCEISPYSKYNSFEPNIWFKKDPHGLFRSEAGWDRLILTDNEKYIIYKEVKSHIPDELNSKELSELQESVYEGYLEIVENDLVLPILCLIQFSHRALFEFAGRNSHWMEKEGVLQVYVGGNANNILLDKLMRCAMVDFLNNTHNKRCNAESLIGTRCFSVGEAEVSDGKIDPQIIPAQFVFRINKHNILALRWSNTICANPISSFLNDTDDLPINLCMNWTVKTEILGMDCDCSMALYQIFRSINSIVKHDDVPLEQMFIDFILEGRV